MTVFRSMFVNTTARSLGEIISRLGAAFFWILVARNLGTSGLGSLAFAISLFSLFASLGNLGLDTVIIRDVARHQNHAGRYFGHSLILGFCSSIVFILVMIVTTRLLQPKAESLFCATILALALMPASAFHWSKTLLYAAEKMNYVTYARIAENTFKVGVGALMLMRGHGIHSIVVVVALSKVLSFVICFWYAVSKVVRPAWKIEAEFVRYLVRQIPSFSMIAIFNSLFWSLSVIMLTKLQGEAAAGIFSAAFKLVDVCLSFAMAYAQALFPVASRMSHENPSFFKSLCQKSIQVISLLTFAIAAVTYMIADRIILFIYGNAMVAAIPVLKVCVWILLPFAIVPILAYALTSKMLHRWDLTANFFGCLSIIFFNMLLIPSLGALGAAIALLASCTIFMFIELYWVQKSLFRVNPAPLFLKPLFVYLMRR